MKQPQGAPLTVIYDGDCGICEKYRQLVQRLDWFHQLQCRPLQDSRLYQEFPSLTSADCEKELKLVKSDQRIYGGADAIIKMFFYLPLLIPFGLLFSMPPFLQITRWLYPKIAANRHRFSKQCGLKK